MLSELQASQLFKHPLESLPDKLLVLIAPRNFLAFSTKKRLNIRPRHLVIHDVDMLQQDQVVIILRQQEVLADSLEGGANLELHDFW